MSENPLAKLLAAPLGPDWTLEDLARRVLDAVANQDAEDQALFLDADIDTDRQSRRLIRPLLACLATLSAGEAGEPVHHLYGGQLCFQRSGPGGLVWVLGHFDNRPGSVKLTLWRSKSPTSTALPSQAVLPGSVAASESVQT